MWKVQFQVEEDDVGTTYPTSQRRQRSHLVSHRKQREAWDRVRPGLLQCYTTSLAMPARQMCMDCPNNAEYRCRDWSSLAYYCESCCRSRHQYVNVLHYPEQWIDGQYVLSPFDGIVIPITHDCSTVYSEKITVISSRG